MKKEKLSKPKNNDQQLLLSVFMRTVWFRNQMKKAFKHGYVFEQIQDSVDINVNNIDDKHLPFYEWFAKHYNE